MKRNIRLNFYVNEEEHKRIIEWAKLRAESQSTAVRLLVMDDVANWDKAICKS